MVLTTAITIGADLLAGAGSAYLILQRNRTLRERRMVIDLRAELNGFDEVLGGPSRERAIALLRSHLDPRQLKEYDTNNGMFRVTGSDGRTYRINSRAYAASVYCNGYTYCIVPQTPYSVPHEDHALGIKLLIEGDIKKFKQIAISS